MKFTFLKVIATPIAFFVITGLLANKGLCVLAALFVVASYASSIYAIKFYRKVYSNWEGEQPDDI